MPSPIPFEDITGSERARKFEGKEHGSTISFFVTSHQPGQGPDLHRHPYEETFIVLEGSGRFTAGDEHADVSAGHVLIVPPNTPHKFEATGDTPLKQVSIHPAPAMEQESLEE